ncbi:MAG TPA: LysM peptidoglycan-binding domain-containing protein [bacterium]|nr:LysM peptidoglycan-binding domain-containing protein [bacterium]
MLGLIVAALAWWGYGKWFSQPAQAGSGAGGAPAAGGADGVELDQLFGGNARIPRAADGAARAGGERADGERAGGERVGGDTALEAGKDPLSRDLRELLAKVRAGDAAATSRAWAAVATGRLGREHDRVVAALAPRGETFADRLRALGMDNSFLHSREGRTAAEAALAAAMAQSDPEALAAGTRLITLMARGRIELADRAARATVDKAYGEHLIRVDRWLCNPSNVAGARSYTVRSGDNLDGIARRFRREGLQVESGTIAVLNRIRNPRALRVGQQLKIPLAPVSAVLEKRSFAMMVFVGDELLRLYWVGHGRNDHTPVTTFEVIEKQERPDWTAPDGNVYAYGHPENILGEYFIKFGHPQYSGFGAHGTPLKETIGTMSSMGCIRMFDADIAELFRILPRRAKVIVRATESVRG